MVVTAFKPSIVPISSPTRISAPDATVKSNSTISPSMRVANFRQPDTPDSRLFFEQPVVRRRVAPIGWQVRREARAVIVDGTASRGSVTCAAHPAHVAVRLECGPRDRASPVPSTRRTTRCSKRTPSRRQSRRRHRAEDVTAGVALRAARSAVGNHREPAPGLNDSLRVEPGIEKLRMFGVIVPDLR